MSATLRIDDLSASHGARVLFSDLDLTLSPGEVVGLTGANGAGKSTLLRALAGDRSAEVTGTVALAPTDATIGYLAQEPERRPGETVAGFLARRTGVARAERAMNDAAERLSTGEDDGAYGPALDHWLALGGADLDERAASVAADIGLGVPLDTEMTLLSGGQAARAGLAALVLSRYDVLLLDEPTNDLDLAGLDRLERFVVESSAAMMVVSHDREFLARTATGILELDRAQQTIAFYDGGYESYLHEREVARRHARDDYDEYASTRAALNERLRTQRNWMEHGVRNARRKAKDNDKAGRKHRAEQTEKQAAKASQTERMIERLEEVVEPRKEWELRLTIGRAPRSGSTVATLVDAVVERDAFTLGPVTTQVSWGDRIVLTGPNGAGKSTLLAVLLGTLDPTSGTATLGSGVAIGEIDQARSLFVGAASLADVVQAQIPDLDPAEVRTLLAKFGLRGDLALRPAHELSPGERTRAGLALLQARGVNLLVLDEPTNHLDLPAIEQLEQAVESFEGTLILVTHDRRMLDTTRATRRWGLEAGRLTDELV